MTATLVRCEAHSARQARCCRSCGVSYLDGGVYFCSVGCMVRFAQELALEFELEVSQTA